MNFSGSLANKSYLLVPAVYGFASTTEFNQEF